MPKIKFISNRSWLNSESASRPEPALKDIPDWYKAADRFSKMPDGKPFIGPDGGKVPTWKACPAIYDILGSGYVYRTPCDIEFYKDDKGKTLVKISDPRYQDFIQKREAMPQFISPMGYSESHFAWFPDWAVSTPKGYSVLYSQPFHRFDLPFITTSGIIDNDKVDLPGSMPFFLFKDWVGIIPAGTPYAQMIPFKREDWLSEYKFEDAMSIMKHNNSNRLIYRKPDGGVYQRDVWERRKYL
jgi:hypothetical protein